MKTDFPTDAKPGDLCVWNAINPPSEMVHYPVKSPGEAKILIDRLAESQLVNSHIHLNAFGLCVFEDGEWLEWYSEDGDDLDAWAESQEGKATTPTA